MRGSSHIQSVLIGVKYRNCLFTFCYSAWANYINTKLQSRKQQKTNIWGKSTSKHNWRKYVKWKPVYVGTLLIKSRFFVNWKWSCNLNFQFFKIIAEISTKIQSEKLFRNLAHTVCHFQAKKRVRSRRRANLQWGEIFFEVG